MLKKSYKTILSDPTGFRKNVKKILYDIEKRLKKIEEGTFFSEIFAEKTHTHSEYSSTNHIHSNYALISTFTITDNSNEVTIPTQFKVSSNNYFIVQGHQYFTFVSATDTNLTLSYTADENLLNKRFLVLYWKEFVEETPPVNASIIVDDVYLMEDEPLLMTVRVVEEGGTPLEYGELNLYVSKVFLGTFEVHNGISNIRVESLPDYSLGLKAGRLFLVGTDLQARFKVQIVETVNVNVIRGLENNIEFEATVLDENGNIVDDPEQLHLEYRERYE